MKILFVIRSLDYGGSERQLAALARALAERRHGVTVAAFYPGGGLEAELRAAGARVHSLGKTGRWDLPGPTRRWVRLARRERPDVIHGYLAGGNMLALMVRPFVRGARVVWGVRASDVDLDHYDWLTRLSYRTEARLSRLPDLIIANSHAGRDHAIVQGFPAERIVVIPNGIDIDRFRPDADARRRARNDWRVAEDEKLIGLVARLDPMKDHPTFLRAAALLAAERQDVRFAVVGGGPESDAESLRRQADAIRLGQRLLWVGAFYDVPAAYNAFDIATCSSAFGEGFPNVVGEAMACGTPCVVTDVGDAARVVDETGIVVPCGEPEALAAGWRAMLERLAREGPALGVRARARIADNFTCEQLARRTEAALQKLLRGPPT